MGNISRVFGVLFILSGILIVLSPISSKFTGFAISESLPSTNQSLAGLWLITVGWSLLLIKRQKKAQAAMEFLMTYGWAILATILAIGTMMYFGIFVNEKSVSNSPLLSPPFIAQSEQWNPETEEYGISVTNGGPIDATISGISISKNRCTTTP